MLETIQQVAPATPSNTVSQPTSTTTHSSSNIKFTSLKDLQEQYRKNNNTPKQVVTITTELLEVCKQEYVEHLQHKKDPSLLAFEQVKIVHKEANQIELLTDMMFNKHFLDDVKDDFHTLLENKFKQSIILSIHVDESLQTQKIMQKTIKSQAQLFEELSKEYPLIKTLKEKLGLSIEY